MQVLTRTHARGADVSLRDATISRDGKQGYGGFGGFRKKSEAKRRTRRFDFWGSLRQDEYARYGRRARWGLDEKDSIEKLCLSPYVETFNSKIIKGFVPKQRSRYVFSNFEIPMIFVDMLPTFDVHFAYGRMWLWYTPLHLGSYWKGNHLVALDYGHQLTNYTDVCERMTFIEIIIWNSVIRNTWNCTSVCKLLVFDRNTLSFIFMRKTF